MVLNANADVFWKKSLTKNIQFSFCKLFSFPHFLITQHIITSHNNVYCVDTRHLFSQLVQDNCTQLYFTGTPL
jgi:hypothetical protein